MTTRFARRMEGLRASEIRELLKLTQRPEVISFAGGLPAPELFPTRELAESAAAVLDNDGAEALQYSPTEGHPRLRRLVAGRMSQVLAVPTAADEVLITSGSQQGLDLTGKVFLDEGDVVLCESPTYLGAIQALRVFRPHLVAVATDDDGMVVADLETKLACLPSVKLIYTVPDFQNPTGRTWSLARRRAVLHAARRHGAVVVEDCPYGQLRYEGQSLPSLAALDGDRQVVFLGRFSKTLCPGLRLGWVAASREILDRYVLVKQGADLHTSTFSQLQVASFLERHDLDDRIATLCQVYRCRRDAMLAALEEEMPPGVHFNRPCGGLFVWVELPAGIDARRLLERCLELDVAFVPGSSFFTEGDHENTLRLNFSCVSEPRIAEGVRRIGRALHEMLEVRRPSCEPAADCAVGSLQGSRPQPAPPRSAKLAHGGSGPCAAAAPASTQHKTRSGPRGVQRRSPFPDQTCGQA